jgi:DNA modification methylase
MWAIEKLMFYARNPRKNEAAGGTAYDPFLGSGTTLAAELTGRACNAIELDRKYVDVAIGRWQSLSGQKAVLEGNGRTFAQIADEHSGEVWDAAA